MVLPEIVAVGLYDSTLAAKNLAISKNRKTSMFEIELPIEHGGVSYVNSTAKPITPNMIICAKPGEIRHTTFPFKCYYVHIIVHSDEIYDTLINAPTFIETDKYDTYKEIFEKLIKHYNLLSDSEEIILQSYLLKLIYTISKDLSQKIKRGSSANNSPVVEASLKYIKDNLTENLTLEKVAKSVSLSPIHFHNTFKASVGKTLHDYIEEQRIKKSINLLLTTNYSLTRIALECGFSSQSYFSYAFKKRMNKTPREYVKDVYNKYEI